MAGGTTQPLPERLRPRSLAEISGQEHLLGEIGPLGRMVASGRLASMILWGPPGSGKTTVARLLAANTGLHFMQLSAVFSGVADLRKVFDEAQRRYQDGQVTVLFVDEIHRFNRVQQDSFLHLVENGTIILVGATTENPSFELNPPLLSRVQVIAFRRLSDGALEVLLQRAEALERALPIDTDARALLRLMADGDGRYLLTLAEEILSLPDEPILDTEGLAKAIQRRAPVYDKTGDGHYNLISALHKAVRGSDPDAALYWLARLLVSGEDPLYITRRIVRIALEDIGLADPSALLQALAARNAYDFLGSPEGELAIAQAVLYLATAPKSNCVYSAFDQARAWAKKSGSLMPPLHALNAPTQFMKDQGYGEGYVYDPGTTECFAGSDYFPKGMKREEFYVPSGRGYEVEIAKRLDRWRMLRKESGVRRS